MMNTCMAMMKRTMIDHLIQSVEEIGNSNKTKSPAGEAGEKRVEGTATKTQSAIRTTSERNNKANKPRGRRKQKRRKRGKIAIQKRTVGDEGSVSFLSANDEDREEGVERVGAGADSVWKIKVYEEVEKTNRWGLKGAVQIEASGRPLRWGMMPTDNRYTTAYIGVPRRQSRTEGRDRCCPSQEERIERVSEPRATDDKTREPADTNNEHTHAQGRRGRRNGAPCYKRHLKGAGLRTIVLGTTIDVPFCRGGGDKQTDKHEQQTGRRNKDRKKG